VGLPCRVEHEHGAIFAVGQRIRVEHEHEHVHEHGHGHGVGSAVGLPSGVEHGPENPDLDEAERVDEGVSGAVRELRVG